MRPKGVNPQTLGPGFGSRLACCFNPNLPTNYLTSTGLTWVAPALMASVGRQGTAGDMQEGPD